MLAGYKLTELARDLTPTQQRWVAFCFIKEMEARNGGKAGNKERIGFDDFMRRQRGIYEFEKELAAGKHDSLFMKKSKFTGKVIKEY